MLKLFSATLKELLMLVRDRTGLLVLFLMPAVLVLVITLVQENIMELTGQKKTRIIMLDEDLGGLGDLLRKQLADSNLELVDWDRDRKDAAGLRAAINEGDYQAGIILAKGATARFRKSAADLFRPHHRLKPDESVPHASVDVVFDPGIMAGMRRGVTSQLRVAFTMISMEAKMENLEQVLKKALAGSPAARQPMLFPGTDLASLLKQPLVILAEEGNGRMSAENGPYNPVQQNVPAWALFGMFFTAIPIAGAILKERSSGIWVRLRILPVSPLVLIGGKIAAYIAVCFCQFLLIGVIGAYLFPHVGLPAFTVALHPGGVALAVIFASLAACGYGIFLGMACNSYEQASTLGATTVVAAAAIGGVMVPVYAMPHTMQRISIISPLNWGLTAFQDLLLRGYSLAAVLDDFGRLFLFFVLTSLGAWIIAARRNFSG